MIEIVFNDSVHGSLSAAQTFGAGEYHGGAIGVFISHGDGSEPTQAEIEEATRQAEEEERQKWEQAVPLGGKREDVYGFSLALNLGDIRDPLCVSDRLNAFCVGFSFFDAKLEREMRQYLTEIPGKLDEVRLRIAGGEDARIWYSSNPEELCGFYWLMDQLRSLPEDHGTLYALRLPDWEESGDVIRTYQGWGEIAPGEFHRFLHLAQPVSDGLSRYFGNRWKELQQENASLRAMMNGRLMSVSEDIYDRCIHAELAKQPDEFREAHLVGNVLGRYQLGVNDGFIHHRIEKMVQQGSLIPVTVAREGEPGYWRTLRKVK